MASSVLRVGDGRGFVVARRNYIGNMERIVITAAHCLPHLPSSHPARDLTEETYKRLLAPLGSKPVIWATCLFVDPIADIAALRRTIRSCSTKPTNTAGAPPGRMISERNRELHRPTRSAEDRRPGAR